MAISCAGLTWATSVPTTALLLFGLGIGWNLSFVAATAQLADASLPAERGKLLGFSDLLSGLTAAALALLGGVALDVLGVAALALGATAIAVAPAIFLARIRHAPEPAA
jgi:MFS family permease